MRKWARYLIGVVAVTGLFMLVTYASAETGKLEMKKVSAVTGVSRSGPPVDYLFRSTYPQRFYQQLGSVQVVRPSEPGNPKFSEVIKKEPPEYAAETPFRGVASLGSGHYGFVLDTAPKPEEKEEEAKDEKETDAKDEKEDSKSEGGLLSALVKSLATPKSSRPKAKALHFTRLYFDLNHNGDLTDDGVIEAKSASASSMNQATFPTVELTIDVDGKKVDYAFTFSVYSYQSSTYAYANASLNSAAYRDGEIVLDGKKLRVVLVDFNSNGRFDDVGGINETVKVSDGRLYPKVSDMLYIDPQPLTAYRNPYDSTSSKDQYQVNKLIAWGDRFYDVKIDPSGETLSLEPSSVPVGYLKNASKGFRAVIYGDQGALEIESNDEGKTPVPEGQWKLMSYTIEQSETAKPDADKGKVEEKEEGSIMELLSSALSTPSSRTTTTPRPRPTVVSASATADFKAVKVVADETVEMKFGPPYQPRVEAQNLRKGTTASLSMSLIGAGGETCSSLSVNGRQPSAPEFTISRKDGEEVAAGKFKYG